MEESTELLVLPRPVFGLRRPLKTTYSPAEQTDCNHVKELLVVPGGDKLHTFTNGGRNMPSSAFRGLRCTTTTRSWARCATTRCRVRGPASLLRWAGPFFLARIPWLLLSSAHQLSQTMTSNRGASSRCASGRRRRRDARARESSRCGCCECSRCRRQRTHVYHRHFRRQAARRGCAPSPARVKTLLRCSSALSR